MTLQAWLVRNLSKLSFECIGQAVSTELQFNTKATVGAAVDDAKIETVAINRHFLRADRSSHALLCACPLRNSIL
nr:hypothetical protein CIT39_04970 [Bradyrhizobium symbiodeficiens]